MIARIRRWIRGSIGTKQPCESPYRTPADATMTHIENDPSFLRDIICDSFCCNGHDSVAAREPVSTSIGIPWSWSHTGSPGGSVVVFL